MQSVSRPISLHICTLELMPNRSPKSPSSTLSSKILSAGVGATVAAAYSLARGHSLASCLTIVTTAIICTLVLDELGWV